MDLAHIIEELRSEKERVEQAIALLDALQGGQSPENGQAPTKHRGRKSMDAEERQEVAARMKKYWENRRNEVED